MASADFGDATVVQFGFTSRSATSLNLGGAQRSAQSQRQAPLTPHTGTTVTFRTVRSLAATRQLVPSRAVRRIAPFASLSLAAITAAPAKGKAVTTAPSASSASVKKVPKDPIEILKFAGAKALSGGLPGMVAMGLQVLTLMWLRTTINYQYRYGTSTMVALTTLFREGGIPRFYAGLGPALIQGPLSRFGDTAANTGCIALLEDVDMPVGLKTVCASAAAAIFRIFLMPVDALKTIMQVEGKTGLASLGNKIKMGGPLVLYDGALAASAATFVGHYPWFAMYNWLNGLIPQSEELPKRLLRSAFLGFCSSFVSDCCSNSIRVIKTSKQAYTVPISYPDVVRGIVAKDGVVGLFGRGLTTKLISNGIQGIMFSVLWRLGQDYYAKQEKAKELAEATLAAPGGVTTALATKKK